MVTRSAGSIFELPGWSVIEFDSFVSLYNEGKRSQREHMAASNLDVAHHVLLDCDNQGASGFFPRVDSEKIDLDRRIVDQALDQLRLGGFVEINGWDASKGQGYRVTDAGARAVAQPALLSR